MHRGSIAKADLQTSDRRLSCQTRPPPPRPHLEAVCRIPLPPPCTCLWTVRFDIVLVWLGVHPRGTSDPHFPLPLRVDSEGARLIVRRAPTVRGQNRTLIDRPSRPLFVASSDDNEINAVIPAPTLHQHRFRLVQPGQHARLPNEMLCLHPTEPLESPDTARPPPPPPTPTIAQCTETKTKMKVRRCLTSDRCSLRIPVFPPLP